MRQRHPYVEEPLTFTYRDIVELLQGAGYERFARYVQQLGQDKTDKLLIDREWREKYAEVVKRLRVHEPPAPPTYDNGGKPGPMSDG